VSKIPDIDNLKHYLQALFLTEFMERDSHYEFIWKKDYPHYPQFTVFYWLKDRREKTAFSVWTERRTDCGNTYIVQESVLSEMGLWGAETYEDPHSWFTYTGACALVHMQRSLQISKTKFGV
jgi:hypothetical protein